MEYFVETLALIGIVIIVASLLSGALERSGLPLVAVFLGLGAALGPWGLGLVDIGLYSPVLRILATVGLALVLFSDAVTIDTREVRARWPLVWRLLGPGTLAPALIIALAAWYLLRLPAAAAALLGAALASTDPVLLRSILRSKALTPTPRLALRLESGLNDVVLLPIVVFSILVLAAGPGGPTAAAVGKHAFGLLVLGPALGALVGWVGISVLIRVRDRVGVRRDYESLYALGLALSGYAAAEAVGGSGFLAAFAAGFVVAAQDVELCDCFLEYGEATAEMLLLFTFVALGTSVIWSGFTVLDGPTLLFAAIALVARTVLLLPILAGPSAGLGVRDRRLIALFGPRGLSSLLFALLPVFAGVAGAERIFTITCLVVLLSVLFHGGGIAWFLRANSAAAAGAATPPDSAGAKVLEPTLPGALAGVPERIAIAELQELLAASEPPLIVDARTGASYRSPQARGAIRLTPDDPVRAANQHGLARHATLVVYCA